MSYINTHKGLYDVIGDDRGCKMAGIEKCKGEGCTNKDKCYRYKVPSSEYQYWMTEQYDAQGHCQNFYHIPKYFPFGEAVIK